MAHLPDSIGALRSLQQLNLDHCAQLSMLPSSLGALASLTFLSLAG